MANMMRTCNLSVSYNATSALESVSVSIPARGTTAVTGPSGCGKSTLLKCLNGLIDEDPSAQVSGERFLDEHPFESWKAKDIRKRVGLVFQNPTPFPFSIEKNLTCVVAYHSSKRPAKSEMDRQVRELLETVGLWSEVRNHLGKSALELSGGQMQRLCIARALAVQPDVLLLDEPCSALDAHSTETIEDLVMRLSRDRAVVLVTHNLDQARRIADHEIRLKAGRVAKNRGDDR